jgi:TetR/AcrR family transcriptional repressor of nem operon
LVHTRSGCGAYNDLVGTIRSAGFSHGGFYNHFQSKGALVAEAFEPAAEALGRVGQSPETFARAMEAYLSVAHRDDPASGCPTAALAADAARQDVAARRA